MPGQCRWRGQVEGRFLPPCNCLPTPPLLRGVSVSLPPPLFPRGSPRAEVRRIMSQNLNIQNRFSFLTAHLNTPAVWNQLSMSSLMQGSLAWTRRLATDSGSRKRSRSRRGAGYCDTWPCSGRRVPLPFPWLMTESSLGGWGPPRL